MRWVKQKWATMMANRGEIERLVDSTSTGRASGERVKTAVRSRKSFIVSPYLGTPSYFILYSLR